VEDTDWGQWARQGAPLAGHCALGDSDKCAVEHVYSVNQLPLVQEGLGGGQTSRLIRWTCSYPGSHSQHRLAGFGCQAVRGRLWDSWPRKGTGLWTVGAVSTQHATLSQHAAGVPCVQPGGCGK